MKFTYASLLISLLAITLIQCSSSTKEKKDDSFTFLKRNAYTVNNYNGLDYYRLNETKEFMHGYYVVGNEMSKWEEFDLKEGVLNGDYILFHPNGEISSHTKYLKGKRHGEELIYNNEGVLITKRIYKKDILFGKQYSYFEGGKIQSESKIENGESIETLNYNLLGNIISQTFIKDGRTITQKIVSGKVFSELVSSNYDDYNTVKFYNEDGSTKIYLRRIEENNTMYILELNEDGDEIKRVDIKANPQDAIKYYNLFN